MVRPESKAGSDIELDLEDCIGNTLNVVHSDTVSGGVEFVLDERVVFVRILVESPAIRHDGNTDAWAALREDSHCEGSGLWVGGGDRDRRSGERGVKYTIMASNIMG